MSTEQHHKRTYCYRKQRTGKQVRSIYIGDANSPLTRAILKLDQLLKHQPARK